MIWAERLADETAHHYAELRQRRVPALPALLMTLTFHRILCRAVLWDDQFESVVGAMLEPSKDERI
jgi:hypothetical protein